MNPSGNNDENIRNNLNQERQKSGIVGDSLQQSISLLITRK